MERRKFMQAMAAIGVSPMLPDGVESDIVRVEGYMYRVFEEHDMAWIGFQAGDQVIGAEVMLNGHKPDWYEKCVAEVPRTLFGRGSILSTAPLDELPEWFWRAFNVPMTYRED